MLSASRRGEGGMRALSAIFHLTLLFRSSGEGYYVPTKHFGRVKRRIAPALRGLLLYPLIANLGMRHPTRPSQRSRQALRRR